MTVNKAIMISGKHMLNVIQGGQLDEAVSNFEEIYLPETTALNMAKIADERVVRELGAGPLMDIENRPWDSTIANLAAPADGEDIRIARQERMSQLRTLYQALYLNDKDMDIVVAGLDPEVIRHIQDMAGHDPNEANPQKLDLRRRLAKLELVPHGDPTDEPLFANRRDIHAVMIRHGLLDASSGQGSTPSITGVDGMHGFYVKDLKQMAGEAYETNRQWLLTTALQARYEQAGLNKNQVDAAMKPMNSFKKFDELVAPILENSGDTLAHHQMLLDRYDKPKPPRFRTSYQRIPQTQEITDAANAHAQGSAAARQQLKQNNATHIQRKEAGRDRIDQNREGRYQNDRDEMIEAQRKRERIYQDDKNMAEHFDNLGVNRWIAGTVVTDVTIAGPGENPIENNPTQAAQLAKKARLQQMKNEQRKNIQQQVSRDRSRNNQ